MKKLMCLILSLVLVGTLAACGAEPAPTTQAAQTTQATTAPVSAEGPFLVGYGRADITPELRVHLAGSTDPENRVAEGIWDNIYATCIAFTDAAGETVLLYHMDLQRADNYAGMARKQLSEELGIPFDNIIISATHTHAAPNTMYYLNDRFPRVTDYMDNTLFPAIVDAGKQALADRKPAELYSAATELTNMNFCRHYLLDDGSYAGDIFGSFKGRTIVRHVVEADPQMQLLCFKREGGKDVVMMNWQAHPHKAGNQHTNVTADIVGSVRSFLETELDCHFAYFTGASGNVNSHSRVSSEIITTDYIQHGQEMGRYALMALDDMQKLELGKVQVATATSHAGELDMPVSAFSIGDVGFAIAPYEMFSENGQFIKENSPFATTFVVTCANGKYGYFPSENTYIYESYEQKADNIPKGNAEEVASTFVELLNQLHPDRALPGQTTSITSRLSDSPLYWNLDRNKTRTGDTVRFLLEGEIVEYRLSDEALLAQIDSQTLLGLTVEGDTITAVHSLRDMPYERISINYYVQTIMGTNLILNSHNGFNGKPVIVPLTNDVVIWNVDEGGQMDTVTRQHRVTAVTDEEGNLLCLYAYKQPTQVVDDPVVSTEEATEAP